MEILNFQDKRWLLKFKYPAHYITPEKIEWYKYYKRADLVLKRNDILFFVEEIPDAEFEEINEIVSDHGDKNKIN